VWGERSVVRSVIESVNEPRRAGRGTYDAGGMNGPTDARHFMKAVIDTFDVSNQITICALLTANCTARTGPSMHMHGEVDSTHIWYSICSLPYKKEHMA